MIDLAASTITEVLRSVDKHARKLPSEEQSSSHPNNDEQLHTYTHIYITHTHTHTHTHIHTYIHMYTYGKCPCIGTYTQPYIASEKIVAGDKTKQ